MADDWEDWEDEGLEPALPGVAGGVNKAPAAAAKKVRRLALFCTSALHGGKLSIYSQLPLTVMGTA